MKQVAKLLIIDPDDNYLLMYRHNHPEYGDDPDLPGGIIEDGETALQAMQREVIEEAGLDIDQAEEIFSSTSYSDHNTRYHLFVVRLDCRPNITISWEHLSYEWLDRETFLAKSLAAVDSYMHMVHAALIRKA